MSTKDFDLLQLTIEADGWPSQAELRSIVTRAVGTVFDELGPVKAPQAELSVLFTDDHAIRQINRKWRNVDKATNVLSFPVASVIKNSPAPHMLGDIVLALETVTSEARVAKMPFNHHLVHLIVHGLLHLLGYDHQSEGDASEMESLETRILARLAIPDPYGMMDQND